MSLVTWPCRKSLASAPVRASLPRSDRSTTKVTDETLALIKAGQATPHFAVELVHHTIARDPRGQRVTDHGGLLGAVEALEQGQQTFQVEGEGIVGHVYSRLQIMPLADEFQEILDALPSDWTDLELDLRVQEDRYIDAA